MKKIEEIIIDLEDNPFKDEEPDFTEEFSIEELIADE